MFAHGCARTHTHMPIPTDTLYLIVFSYVILAMCKSCQHAQEIRFDSRRKLCLDLWILAYDDAFHLLSKQKNTHAPMKSERRSYYWNVKVRERGRDSA